jgi:CheY-like chemotaxis protein
VGSLRSTTGSLDVEPPTPPTSDNAPSSTGSTSAEALAMLHQEEESVLTHTLIVDDNLLNRRLLVAFMRKNGIQFEEASNGLVALQMYQEGPRKFDVILMDMSMPVMDGMSSTRAIREHEEKHHMPRCFIVALTGLASSSAKLEAWSSGIDHFMTKPINFKDLGKLLRSDELRRQTIQADVGITKPGSDMSLGDDPAT